MELNKNSFTAKLVKYCFPFNGLANNLCDFFWQVFLAYVFSPFILIHYIYKSKFFRLKYEEITRFDMDSFSWKIYLVVRAFCIVSLFFTFFYYVGKVIQKDITSIFYVTIENTFLVFLSGLLFVILIFIGTLIGGFSLFGTILLIYPKLIEQTDLNINFKFLKENIFIQYFNAKKEKHCYKINWKE